MLKKWLIRFFVLLLIFISISLIFIYVQQDKLKEKVLNSLNEKLESEVSVDGLIDITFLRTFPKVTLELNEVFIADKFNLKDTLASVQKINFTINPLSLLGETLSIQSIVLQNGKLRLKTFKDGKSNYDILKTQGKNNPKGANLNLEEIVIHNIDLIYDNRKANVFVNILIHDANLSGKFYNSDFELFVNLDAKSRILKISNATFLSNNDLKANFDLFYKSENQCISFLENNINIERNQFNVIGDICVASNEINLLAKANGTNLANALKLVPTELFQLQGISGSGKYAIELNVKEKLNKPKITLNFNLDNAKAKIDIPGLKVTDLFVTGTYKNFPRNNLVVKDFALKSGESNLKGNISIPNLENLKMDLKLNGAVYSALLAKFDNDIIAFQNGKIDLDNILFNFNFREKDSVWVASRLEGELEFNDLSGMLKDIDQSFKLNADIKLLKQKININSLIMNIGNNDLNFKGSLKNALNFFQDNIFGTNDALIVNGDLSSTIFNINDFLKETEKELIVENKKDINITKWLNIESSVHVDVAKLVYQKLELVEISSLIKSNEAGLFSLKNLEASALGGTANGNVELRFLNNKMLEVFIDSKLKKINIEKLFSSLDNFGQNTLTSKNVKGSLNADLILSMTFKNFKEFQNDDLIMQCNFDLNDGELIQLESLKSLSKFLSLEQLEHIYFSQYKSAISIANKEIQLSRSKLKSNLVSLEIGGTHTFDNQINYALKLNLNNLLATKFKKKKTLNADYVNDVQGGINLFLSMKGSVENPIIKMDKQSAYKNLQKSLKQEKQDLKDLLKKDKVFFEEEKTFYYENDSTEFLDFDNE